MMRTQGKREKVSYSGIYDLIVVGGGLAGISAAISAARLGCRVALVQDRPVLGGNSSSEIKVHISGAQTGIGYNPWARETGIIEELLIEDRFCNPGSALTGRINSIWDILLYEWVKREKNIDLFLNSSAREAVMAENNRIEEVVCVQLGTERIIRLKGNLFIDASGDGALAYSAGAEFRMGREARQEFNESFDSPEKADHYTLGSSLLFLARDMGHPVPFEPPPWAAKFLREEDLPFRNHRDTEAGYWWIEVGGDFNTVYDNESIRDELLRQLLGVWDHIKNQGDHGAENLALEWVGMVPGKRESRRFIGDYILTERDVKSGTLFPDRVAYGGWLIDTHTVGGILAKGKPTASFVVDPRLYEERLVNPYSIPFRCLYSKNIKNLMMAGRNISVTHVALATTRVMATCAVIGQAAGTAAYLCKKYNVAPNQIYPSYVEELQQLLLKQDCYIPRVRNQDQEDLAREAKISASSSATLEFKEGKKAEELRIPHAQLFPVSSNLIESVSLLLESHSSKEEELQLGLRPAETVWDFSATKDIVKAKARIFPNTVSWVNFKLQQLVTPHKLYWIWLKPQKKVFWRHSDDNPVGTVAAHKPYAKWLRIRGSYSLKLDPPSHPYSPENILNGVARPEDWTNIWVSDPDEGFPQFIELEFGEPRTLTTIYLTFDTNLNRVLCRTPGLFKAPECIRDYVIYYLKDQQRIELLRVKDNYHRRRVHHFQAITARKLGVEILATNGSDSARIYEIRVYKEGK